MATDDLIEKIERGDYRIDPEASTLVRLAIQEGDSGRDNSRVMVDFYASIDQQWQRFANDALLAVGLAEHPRAIEILKFASDMAGADADLVKVLAILRRIASLKI